MVPSRGSFSGHVLAVGPLPAAGERQRLVRCWLRDAFFSVARNGRHDAGGEVDLAHASVVQIGNVKLVAGRIKCNTHHEIKRCCGSRPTIAGKAGLARTGQRVITEQPEIG